MTDEAVRRLSARIVALPGVRGLFPDHPVGALARALVVSRGERASALVGISTDDTATRVHLRLALQSSTPSAQTLRAVHAVISDAFPGARVATTVEIAYID